MSGTDRLITLDRLQAMLDAYGAEPDRWPAEQRAGAVALIESSDEARAMFEEAAALDGVLDRMPVPSVSPAHMRRMRHLTMPSRRARAADVLAAVGDWLKPGSRFAWQSAVAAAAVVGLVAGIGFSEIVLDHEGDSPATVAAQEAAPPAILISGIDGGTPPGSLALEQDVRVLSLTGSRGTATGTVNPIEDGELSVASIPLY